MPPSPELVGCGVWTRTRSVIETRVCRRGWPPFHITSHWPASRAGACHRLKDWVPAGVVQPRIGAEGCCDWAVGTAFRGRLSPTAAQPCFTPPCDSEPGRTPAEQAGGSRRAVLNARSPQSRTTTVGSSLPRSRIGPSSVPKGLSGKEVCVTNDSSSRGTSTGDWWLRALA